MLGCQEKSILCPRDREKTDTDGKRASQRQNAVTACGTQKSCLAHSPVLRQPAVVKGHACQVLAQAP